MQTFDHFAISAATLAEGAAHVEAQTGHSMGPGGKHALMSTHNRLSGLGSGEYLELIAIDPDAPPPGRTRWFDLDRRQGPPRIGNWILRTTQLEALVARFPQAGRPVAMERGAYRWRMAIPDDGILPFDGCFPALIQWDSAAPVFPDSGLSMTGLTLQHPEASDLGPILSELTDDPRITLRHGARKITAQLATPSGPRTLA